MTIFDIGHGDSNYFHCFLCISFLFHSKTIRWSVPSTKIVLCWKRQCGRKDFIIQDLLSWVQHYGNDHQLQAVFFCIPVSGMKTSFCISKNSVEHKLCRNTVNLFFIPLCVFDVFGREKNRVHLECCSVLKMAGWPVFAGSMFPCWVSLWFYLNMWTRLIT